MSSVTLAEKNLGGESDMPSETVPHNNVESRSDKEDSGTNSTKQTSGMVDTTKNKNASMNSSGNELQVSKVSSSNSEQCYTVEKSKSGSKISEKTKRKAWYNVIYPSYKSRSEQFKKLFKEVPDDQRLIVDYSCALQREILVHGRMYVSQHYMCFHANIFGWETYLTLKWKNVTALTKEKTALVIPNAILITTDTDKYFITSFAARDKTYLMLFRIWQNALLNKSMLPQEIWQCVHNVYGEQLGLTSDDEEDYIDPKEKTHEKEIEPNAQTQSKCASTSETETDQSFERMPSTKIVTSNSGGGGGAGDSSTLRPNQPKSRTRNDLEANEIPTDASNSTDSEEENSIPFECTAECTSMHEGRQLIHTILPINVDSLLTMLFSKSKFFAEFHNMRKTTNMVYRDWVDNGDGTKSRTINFTVAVTQPVGPKTSNLTETQLMRECSVPGQLYSIDVTAQNAGIPYADSFTISQHYCLLRTVDDHTMLSVYVQIKYTKHVWGVIKGFIEKNVWSGMENFYKDLIKALQSEYCIPPAKSKSRRTKRALSQKSSVEEVSSKRSSLKSTTKTIPIPLTVSPTSTTPTNPSSTQCSDESIPDHSKGGGSFSTYNMFSIFVVLLIGILVLLNIYLLSELYSLKYKQSDSIQIDKELLDKLAATGDPNEMKEKWLGMMSQQKTIHEAELVKWQGFVRSAVDLLKNVKEIYTKFNLDLKNVDDHMKDEF